MVVVRPITLLYKPISRTIQQYIQISRTIQFGPRPETSSDRIGNLTVKVPQKIGELMGPQVAPTLTGVKSERLQL